VEESPFRPELDRDPPEEEQRDEQDKEVLKFIELHKRPAY
jgi:hypothetical protein